jgi:RNA polymerase sigma factor (sigma-70 family)
MSDSASPSEPGELQTLIDGFTGGDESQADSLCRLLAPSIRRAATRFLGPGGAELDDVVQDSLIAVMTYLRRRRKFEGDLTKVSVTIASNRCRDILRTRARRPQVPIEDFGAWLADPSRSPLDHLLESEVTSTLQRALDRLDPTCRRLLHAFYLAGTSIEDIRIQTGLTTVQGVYHRRMVCLKFVARLLNNRPVIRPAGQGAGG